MRYRDFLLLMGVCFIWALNVIVGKVMLSDYAVPPFYDAAIRFFGVAIVLSPLLRPVPQRVLQVVLLVGANLFRFLFLGLSAASALSAAIVLQLGIPLTAMLSVLFLGEQISAMRMAGIVGALSGVITVMWNPGNMAASIGLVAIEILIVRRKTFTSRHFKRPIKLRRQSPKARANSPQRSLTLVRLPPFLPGCQLLERLRTRYSSVARSMCLPIGCGRRIRGRRGRRTRRSRSNISLRYRWPLLARASRWQIPEGPGPKPVRKSCHRKAVCSSSQSVRLRTVA
ncbi:DMT family transporter [Agrobacterium tumefaciens]|nr:DMT family transporter [Agrobacterium tumefaciens]NSZ09390.1 DMT family transporter [Agrobacterium tumefaciens]